MEKPKCLTVNLNIQDTSQLNQANQLISYKVICWEVKYALGKATFHIQVNSISYKGKHGNHWLKAVTICLTTNRRSWICVCCVIFPGDLLRGYIMVIVNEVSTRWVWREWVKYHSVIHLRGKYLVRPLRKKRTGKVVVSLSGRLTSFS